METLSLTEIIERQKEFRDNIKSDIKADWLFEGDRNQLQMCLLLINASIGNLEAIAAENKDSQIFRSSIKL